MSPEPQITIREERLCARLARLLCEHAVGDSLGDEWSTRDLMASFEYFLPDVLREARREWRSESLDGIYPQIFRKIGVRDAELVGLAIFISDQSLNPIHLQLQLASEFDRIAWLDLRLGEQTSGGRLRVPYREYNEWKVSPLLDVAKRYDSIDWYYHVGYGKRQS
jgi:hypothetical protein